MCYEAVKETKSIIRWEPTSRHTTTKIKACITLNKVHAAICIISPFTFISVSLLSLILLTTSSMHILSSFWNATPPSPYPVPFLILISTSSFEILGNPTCFLYILCTTAKSLCTFLFQYLYGVSIDIIEYLSYVNKRDSWWLRLILNPNWFSSSISHLLFWMVI